MIVRNIPGTIFLLRDSRCVPGHGMFHPVYTTYLYEVRNSFSFFPDQFLGKVLTPLQLETPFWGQNYLDFV